MQPFIDQHYYTVLFIFFSVVLAGNLPVGFLRSRYTKFSRPWARCIYIPIVANIVLRRLVGLTAEVIPLIVIAVLIGQIIGVRLYKSGVNGPDPV